MAVKLRLMRMGKKKQPTYRVVAADGRSPRDGRFIDILGHYDPRQEPSLVSIDTAKADEWIAKGASFREVFRVYQQSREDIALAEEWDDFINGILPVELVHLFLFDGEKIEALANPERLPQLLRRATEVFLGLGGIDALATDLKAVERRAGGKKSISGDINEVQAQLEQRALSGNGGCAASPGRRDRL